MIPLMKAACSPFFPAVFLSLLFVSMPASAGSADGTFPLTGITDISYPPQITCPSAVLIDVQSGAVLFSKNRDDRIPPASMTKLMSLHLAYKAIGEGRLSMNQLIPVGRAAAFQSSPPRSSLMFLEEGQRVTLREIMIGCAIPSGNDAAIALAIAVSGSVEAFVAGMNREAERLGMTSTGFVEPSGYDAGNVTTAWDFARFCLFYIREHPEAMEELHSLPAFTYPKGENIPPGGRSALGPITQPNHNNLVGRLDGVDGLKTGYIDESGYNIAVTAERNGRRLLAVLMGGEGETTGEGNLQRAIDATALLSYGFFRFATFVPEPPPAEPVRIYGGRARTTIPVAAEIPAVTVSLETLPGLRWERYPEYPLKAPLSAGTVLGELVLVRADGNRIATVPLLAESDIPRGGWLKRFRDWLILGFRSVFNKGQ